MGIEIIYTCSRLTGVREQPISNGIPLATVSSWYTPSFLLFTSSLAYNNLSSDMILTLIPPVSIWGDEVSLTLEMVPPIGSLRLNNIHLNPEPDLPLTPNYASDYIPRSPDQNHSFPPIDITVLTPILSWHHLTTIYDVLPLFSCTIFLIPNITYSPAICLNVFPFDNVMGSLNLTPFMWNSIRFLFPVIRVCSQIAPLSDPLLNLLGTMRFVVYQWYFYLLIATSFEFGHCAWIAWWRFNRCT